MYFAQMAIQMLPIPTCKWPDFCKKTIKCDKMPSVQHSVPLLSDILENNHISDRKTSKFIKKTRQLNWTSVPKYKLCYHKPRKKAAVQNEILTNLSARVRFCLSVCRLCRFLFRTNNLRNYLSDWPNFNVCQWSFTMDIKRKDVLGINP